MYMRSGEPSSAGFWTEGSQSSQDENEPGPSGTAKQSREISDSY